MSQKGQFLEIVMANLQSYLAPEGVDVNLREKFYSADTGKQVGEIDITVRGDFGPSKFFIGIECRDRPAEGPQSLPWIREIVGKRDQLGVDKMVAVSSTGFTADAQHYANAKNIDLITFATPTEHNIKKNFKLLERCYTDWHFNTTKPVTLNLLDPTRNLPAEALDFRPTDAVFMVPAFQPQPQSLSSLLETKVSEHIDAKRPKQITLSESGLMTENPNDFDAANAIKSLPVSINAPLSVELRGRIYPLRNVTTEVDVTPRTRAIKSVFNVCSRLSDNKAIALTSTVRLNMGGQEMVFVCILKEDNNEQGSMSMRLHFYDTEGNPMTLPRGVFNMMTLVS